MTYECQLSAGDVIRSKRTAAGHTQETFADLIGVTQPAVCHWENGTNEPSAANYRRIAEALDIDLAELLAMPA